MKYAAIYGRASLGRERQGETIEHQIELIQEFARRSDIDVVFDNKFIYEDEGSGFKTTLLQRPAMRQLLSDIDADLIGTVFFKGISRFARDSGEAITTAKRLHNKGVRVISIEENYDSIRDEPTMFQIYSVMAEQESRKTGIRVSLGHKSKARQGLWSNASTPYGYVRVKDLPDQELKKKLLDEGRHEHSLHPTENAIVVKQVFDMYVNLGYGRKRIASELNEKGYKTKKGLPINDKFVYDILNNEAYIGNVTYGKSRYNYVEKDDMSKKIQKTIKVSRDNWAIAENAHPPIIDKETFEKAQQIFQRKKSSFNFDKKFNAAKHPLTGILKCGKCGAGMICQKRTNRMKDGTKKEYRYYVCSTYHKKGRLVCSQANVPADELEAAVYNFLKVKVDQLWDKIDKNKIQEKQNNNDGLKQELKLVEGTLTKKLNAVKSLMEMRELYDTETFMSLNKDLNVEIKTLRQQKEKIESNLKTDDKSEQVLDIKEFIDEFKNSGMVEMSNLRSFFSKVIMEVVVEEREVKSIKTIPFS